MDFNDTYFDVDDNPKGHIPLRAGTFSGPPIEDEDQPVQNRAKPAGVGWSHRTGHLLASYLVKQLLRFKLTFIIEILD